MVADLDIAGFVRTGYFGKYWPATVAEIAADIGEIRFVRQDGTRHTYRKFDGYDMRMIRLRAGDKETIVVLRSKIKMSIKYILLPSLTDTGSKQELGDMVFCAGPCQTLNSLN
jgi:hypothetical protein